MQITKPEMVRYIETMRVEFAQRFGIIKDSRDNAAQLQCNFLFEKCAILACAVEKLERQNDELEKRLSKIGV